MCGFGGSCRILCGSDDSHHTTRGLDDSCLSSAVPWFSTASVAFFTDRLHLSSTSACGSDGTCTSDFNNAHAPTCHGGAHDSPGESSPDVYMHQGCLPDASGSPHPRHHDHLEPSSPIPTSVLTALANPNWCAAMEEECETIMSNGAWELILQPCGSNVVTGKWIFTHKSL
jgi:hypothetical protein